MNLKDLFPKASNGFLKANEKILNSIAPDIRAADKSFTPDPPRVARRGIMNRTEGIFKLMLQRRFPDCEIRFEAYKLRIADRCYYCPDFAVIHLSGLIDFYECKGGHIWEDSLIKCKAAKEMYQHHVFEMWQCKKGSWKQIL